MAAIARLGIHVAARCEQRPGPRAICSGRPERPNLIDVDACSCIDADGGEIDGSRATSACAASASRDGRFLLNDRPYYRALGAGAGLPAASHLAAPSADALRREVELIKALGFNAARIHQKVEDPRFLYWCDRLGLLVWGEMANAYEFSPSTVERLTREWLEVVRRDRSHPCIVTWVPINESWGVADIALRADAAAPSPRRSTT